MILAVSVEAASLEGTGHLSKTWTVGYLRYHGFVEGGEDYFSLWWVTSSRARDNPKAPAPTIITELMGCSVSVDGVAVNESFWNCSRRVFVFVFVLSTSIASINDTGDRAYRKYICTYMYMYLFINCNTLICLQITNANTGASTLRRTKRKRCVFCGKCKSWKIIHARPIPSLFRRLRFREPIPLDKYESN